MKQYSEFADVTPKQEKVVSDWYLYYKGKNLAKDWDIEEWPLIMRKQTKSNEIKLDMRYKVNREYLKKIENMKGGVDND